MACAGMSSREEAGAQNNGRRTWWVVLYFRTTCQPSLAQVPWVSSQHPCAGARNLMLFTFFCLSPTADEMGRWE